MEIEQIISWIQEEFNKGNTHIYKKIKSFCNSLYRQENKDKVAIWNKKYYYKNAGGKNE